MTVASGPAAFAQDTDNSSENSGGNSVSQSGVRNEGTADNDVTGGQRTAGNTVNRGSNINQGSSSIAGGVTSGGAPVAGTGLSSTAATGGAASSGSGATASPKSTSAATTADGALARTGGYTTQLALLGFGVLLVGCLMVRYSWRPRMLVSASATSVREALAALADLHSRA